MVVKRTNSFTTAQTSFLELASDDIKKIEVGKHTLVSGVAKAI